MSLLFKMTYGLFLLSAKDGDKQNACMVNTVIQQTSTPEQLSVTVNKNNFTCDIIAKTGVFVANILSTATPFDFVKNFGMQSGKTVDKFSNIKTTFSKSGIATNLDNSLGYFELKATQTVDLGTHIMFIGETSESQVLGEGEPLTYAYYHANVKPKPAPATAVKEETWVCSICNYVHNGALPQDIICPICKHGASDFIKQ